MAEIITTNETAPQDDMVVADGAMPHADEVMVDETTESSTGMPMPDAYPAEQVSEATALPERTTTGASQKEMPPSRRPSLQAHASGRWTAERPLADPVEAPRTTTSTAHTPMPAWCGEDSIPAAQVPRADTSRADMPPPESFTPQDLAMENNPITTARPPLRAHDSTISTTEPAPMDSDIETASMPSETSATGRLVLPVATTPSRITFEEYLMLSEITFEWGDSYDDKNWVRLRAILAPTLMVDYTDVNGHKWDAMTAEDFVSIMSHIGFVGDPLVHTQHHIGASKWTKISDEEVIGHHQLRAAHQRYTALDMKTVENKGHGHAMVKHFYRKVDGEWKLAGLRPTVRWNEFEFEKIFQGL